MSNELVKQGVTGTLTVRTMDDLARLGNMLAQSGFFTDSRDAAQAGVKVLAGLEMGIGAFSAMSGIHIIKGKPSIGAGLMAAGVKRHPKYDYRVRRHDATGCEIEFFQEGESIGVSSFTSDDAKAAGLLGNDNYKRNPKNMYFARALSNGVRWYCPDVFDVSTYTPEELGADVDDDGNIIEVQAAPKKALESAPKADEVVADLKPGKEEAPPLDLKAQTGKAERITKSQVDALAAIAKDIGIDSDAMQMVAESTFDRELKRGIKDLTYDEAAELTSWDNDKWLVEADAYRVPVSAA